MDFVLHLPGRPGCLPYAVLVQEAPEGDLDLVGEFARAVIEAGAVAPDAWGRVSWGDIESGSIQAEIPRSDGLSNLEQHCKG